MFVVPALEKATDVVLVRGVSLVLNTNKKLEQGLALGGIHSFFYSIVQQIFIEDHCEPSTVLEAEKAWEAPGKLYFLSTTEKFRV